MVGEEAHDDGIAEEGALHTTAFDREVDDPDDQHVARPSPGDVCCTVELIKNPRGNETRRSD